MERKKIQLNLNVNDLVSISEVFAGMGKIYSDYIKSWDTDYENSQTDKLSDFHHCFHYMFGFDRFYWMDKDKNGFSHPILCPSFVPSVHGYSNVIHPMILEDDNRDSSIDYTKKVARAMFNAISESCGSIPRTIRYFLDRNHLDSRADSFRGYPEDNLDGAILDLYRLIDEKPSFYGNNLIMTNDSSLVCRRNEDYYDLVSYRLISAVNDCRLGKYRVKGYTYPDPKFSDVVRHFANHYPTSFGTGVTGSAFLPHDFARIHDAVMLFQRYANIARVNEDGNTLFYYEDENPWYYVKYMSDSSLLMNLIEVFLRDQFLSSIQSLYRTKNGKRLFENTDGTKLVSLFSKTTDGASVAYTNGGACFDNLI